MRLTDIKNIDYIKLEDSLHCIEHHKGDEVEYVICAPLVEAIPKDQYESRLKADMVAMLTDIQLEFEELQGKYSPNYDEASQHLCEIIQEKINTLKGNENEGNLGGKKMNKTVELKPCPFCGGRAILNASHSVECDNACICPVIPRTWTYDTDEEAIEAWNHRIPTV